MRCDERLAVSTELERRAVVLADQVAQPRLGKPDPRAKLGRVLEGPLELLGRGLSGVCYPHGRIHFLRVEERRRGGVDGAREEHEAFSEDIRRESDNARSMKRSGKDDRTARTEERCDRLRQCAQS